MLKIQSTLVRESSIVSVFSDLLPLFQIKALNLTILRNEDDSRVTEVEGECAGRTGRNRKLSHTIQSKCTINKHGLVFHRDEVLATLGESDLFGILVLIEGGELPQVRMQDVIETDLIIQGDGHIIATWMKGTGDKRLRFITQTKCEVQLELTLVILVVPESDVLVLVRHGQQNRSLETCMHLSDFARMESVSDQLIANSCDLLLL